MRAGRSVTGTARLLFLPAVMLAQAELPPPATGQGGYLDFDLPSVSTFTLPAPPPNVRLAEPYVTDKEWRGLQCAVTEPRYALFRHADKWRSFWERGMAPYAKRLANVPAIDFEKDMVAGVFLGLKPQPHFEVEIRSIKKENRPDGTVLVVRYREIAKMQGVFVPPFPVQPYHLKKVPRFDGRVEFVPVKRRGQSL